MSFFSFTLKAIEQEHSSLNLFLLESLRKGGISLHLCDLWCGTDGIYLLLNDFTLIRVFVHRCVLGDKEFHEKGAPCFHFMPCADVEQIVQQSDKKPNYSVSIALQNAFTFKISGKRANLGVYHDAPLEPCPLCLEMAHKTALDVQRDFEYLSSSLYSPKAGITPDDYQSLMDFFGEIFHDRCGYCHKKASRDSLFLVQNEEGEFSLVCDQHEGA